MELGKAMLKLEQAIALLNEISQANFVQLAQVNTVIEPLHQMHANLIGDNNFAIFCKALEKLINAGTTSIADLEESLNIVDNILIHNSQLVSMLFKNSIDKALKEIKRLDKKLVEMSEENLLRWGWTNEKKQKIREFVQRHVV